MLSKLKDMAAASAAKASELAAAGLEKIDQSAQDGALARLSESAKKATASVQNNASVAAKRAGELASQAAVSGQKVAGLVHDGAAAAATKAGELATAGLDQLNKSIDEITNGSDEIREIGYELDRIVVELGLIPKAGLGVIKLRDVEPSLAAEVIERNKDKKTLHLVLRALIKTDAMMSKVDLRGRRVDTVEVELSVPPVARFVFRMPRKDDPGDTVFSV